MPSDEQLVSLLEFLYKKPGVSLSAVPEASETLAILIRDVFDDLQRSKTQLGEQVTTLETRNKELEAYAHMVAHDLKEPLTIMLMTTDLIKDVSDLTGEELKDCLLRIESTAYEMRSIIKSLLLFAEVSKAEAPRGTVHMAQVVANVQARLSHIIRQQQAQLIVPEVWPEAVGYGPWIEEVWANFLSNALKYGGRPPRVELGASPKSDDMLSFWTRDNGPGIPLEAQTHLFNSNVHINPISNLGNGLGLPIVHSIVEKMGGQVGVESEVGHGSLFYFTLPAVSKQ